MFKSTIFSVKGILALIIISIAACDVENYPPTITVVHISPEIIEVGKVATVHVVAADLDQDIMEFEYTVSGGYLTGFGSVVQWHAPQTTGAFVLNVTVTDGRGGEAFGDGSLIVVQEPK